MFTFWSLNKYATKLLPRLEQRYGKKVHYTPSQVRSTVYHCNFNPQHLVFGYLLALHKSDLTEVMTLEFPDLCLTNYKQEIQTKLKHKRFAKTKQQIINQLAID